ncbi:PAS domain-containing protein, partial [bacterium]|nr:PAS domain-containing protein [bacterium]
MPSVRKSPTRRRAKLHASAEEILKLLARSADGVFAVDADQRIVFWSAAAEELVGRSAGDLLGRYCYEVLLGKDYEG